jgi:predicted ester cyclase
VPDVRATADAYYAALAARDLDAVALTLDPACRADVPGAVLEGREQIIAWMQAFFDAYPDIHHVTGERRVEGPSVSTDLRVTGTHTRRFVMPEATIAATGRSLDLTAHNEMTVRDGKIVRLRIDFDPRDLMRQLGVV